MLFLAVGFSLICKLTANLNCQFAVAASLSPIICSAAMMFSSVSVISKALRLRKVEL